MIKKIGIENFRVFKDYTEFEVAPITVLTGPNNSGKSSFLKLINLLKLSFDNNYSFNQLYFNDGNHNLGTFKNTTNWSKSSGEIKIVLDFPLNYFDQDFQLELIYCEYMDQENGVLTSFKIFNDNLILFELSDSYFDKEITYEVDYEFKMNFQYLKRTILKETDCKIRDNYSKEINKSYQNYISKFDEDSISQSELEYKQRKKLNLPLNEIPMPFDEYVESYFFKEYDSISNNSFQFFEYYHESGESINDDELAELENKSFLETKSNDHFGITRERGDLFTDIFYEDGFALEELERTNPIHFDGLKSIRVSKENAQLLNKFFIHNVNKALEKLKFSFGKLSFLSASRGNKNRVLTNSSSNDLDEIIKTFSLISSLDNEIHRFMDKSLAILNIKGKLTVKRIEGSNSLVYLESGNDKINLSDLGYGYSQIIPILLKIVIESHWSSLDNNSRINPFMKENYWLEDKSNEKPSNEFSFNPLIIIEEPEANLHPNLQSKLADILILAHKSFGVQFILETHSEYLIRKLQYLTAKKEIETNDVNIYYFNDDKYVNENEPKVKKIQIDEFGALTDEFGPGFYDESTNLRFELYNLNQGQKN